MGTEYKDAAANLADPTRSKRFPLCILGGFILLYAAILVVNLIMGVGPNLLMKWLGVSSDFRAYLGNTFSYSLRLVAYIVLPALALRDVSGMDPRPTFFPLRNNCWRDLLFGFLLVAGVLAVFFAVEVRAGWLVIDGWIWQQVPLDAWLRVAWVGFLVNLSVAVGEETIFRGYLLSSLKLVWGCWRALLAMMVIFGLFHLFAYSEEGLQSGTLALAILLATLFGGLFGLVYLRTGSLWLPVILHFSWNFVENDVFNLSGDLNNLNLVGALTHLQKPLTMTEMGLGNMVVVESLAFACIALGLWLWLRHRTPQQQL
jgi:membrane protease YdiL (CAAX protease family)